MSKYADTPYPLFFEIRDRTCVVVGGGPAAEKEALALVEYDADVVVISPETTPSLSIMAETHIVTHISRAYQEGDLVDAWLVVAASGDADTDARVYREAESLHTPVRVLSDESLSVYKVPSVVRRDPIQIAVSTNGASDGLETRLKDELEVSFGPEYTDYADLLGEARDILVNTVYGTEEDREPYYQKILDSDLFERIKEGEYLDGEDVYITYIKPEIDLGDRLETAEG